MSDSKTPAVGGGGPRVRPQAHADDVEGDLAPLIPPRARPLDEKVDQVLAAGARYRAQVTAILNGERPRQTMEAVTCDAIVTAFEALQTNGIYLHGADGVVLQKQQFIDAMLLAMNAALAGVRVRSPQEP